MSKLTKLLETSIVKTLRFNLHYFGGGGCVSLCLWPGTTR